MHSFATIEHLADYDIVPVEDRPPFVPLAEHVARHHDPIILTQAGVPVAALVGLDDLNSLYEELRCLRTLYAVITERRPRAH